MMNKDKHIEETWKEIYKLLMLEADCSLSSEDCRTIADLLIINGYRKAEDVVREIFEEIEEIAGRIDRNNMSCLRTLSETTIEKLKKKYTKQE